MSRYSYTEVSTSLKIPLSTVKKRLYSARQKLRVQLQATLRETGARASCERCGGGCRGCFGKESSYNKYLSFDVRTSHNRLFSAFICNTYFMATTKLVELGDPLGASKAEGWQIRSSGGETSRLSQNQS
jgi:hypothetical protein